MKVSDLVRFNEENYFNGAIQTEWFYDLTRVEKISSSYVFHGPKYFGVSSNDILQTNHKLIDTASFTKKLADKIYSVPKSASSNNFIMTIAGYGTGKSHLAISLGALFSGNKIQSEIVANRIILADEEIGEYVKRINTKKNMIIVLNGMQNFNLDAKILECIRFSLKNNGISEDILSKITQSYDIAKRFVKKKFSSLQEKFEKSANYYGLDIIGEDLKSYLLQHIETDNKAIDTINEVYTDVTGGAIHWEQGISAGDILTLVQNELCGDEKPFNKILVLFDEFGRYIEYAAAYPVIAGEAALQQIFEAVQNANNKIIFVGFIQNDLTAYLSRIEKTANISRYVGRYENSEKLYLSSNFETILASLLEKNETSSYSTVIENATQKYRHYHTKIFDSLSCWDKSVQKKYVWTSTSLYQNVILKGCYPMHPITVWLLANTSSWMQQRSTFAFIAEMFENIKNLKIEDYWLPYIYPIDIVDSNIFHEMLNSEEKGLVQSQFCILYQSIIIKVGNKLTEQELKVLKAIFILNIGKFLLRDKGDAITAIHYFSNLKEEETNQAINRLENIYGVISFDENVMTYDLIIETNGFYDFKLIYNKYRLITAATIDDIDSDLLNEASLTGIIETSFSQEHNISSIEWVYEIKLIASKNIDSAFFNGLKKCIDGNYTVENPRGYLIYAYCNENRNSEISRLAGVISEVKIEQYPIIILFLDDAEQEITDALTVKKTMLKFSKSDQDKFSKHIISQTKVKNKKILEKFEKLKSQRLMITENGLSTYNSRVNSLCSTRFNELYTKTPPFAFDGFQNKVTAQARKYLSNICIKMFDKTLMNIQSYQALTRDEKNRVKSCLSVGFSNSWQVFDTNCCLIDPQNPLIKEIYDGIDAILSDNKAKSVMELMDKYLRPPYGLNINMIFLFIFYFMAHHGNTLLSFYGQDKLTASHLSDNIFKSSKPQITEIRKIKLQVNVNAEVDQVVEMCRKALICTNIEEFTSLKNKLKDIIKQEGMSASNQQQVASVMTRLAVGLRLLDVISKKNEKSMIYLDAARVSFDIPKFVNILNYITDFTKPLSDEYEFTCGESLNKQIKLIEDEFNKIIHRKYYLALSELKCNITQLSQMKSIYNRVTETLENNGYYDFAKATKQRIKELEIELTVKQKYNEIFAELNKDIHMYSDITAFSYQKLTEVQTEMEKWKMYINDNNDIPNSIASPLIEKIEQLITKSSSFKIEMLAKLSTIVAQVNNATLQGHLLEAQSNLEEMKKLGFDSSKENEIENILVNIRNRIQYIGNLPDVLDDLVNMKSTTVVTSDIVIRNELNRKIERTKQEQNEWVNVNIIPIYNISDEMSASDCVNWLKKTEILPNYLSSMVKTEYNKVKLLVDNRLHACKIEGVVSMFNSLSDIEKKQCLNILLKQISPIDKN